MKIHLWLNGKEISDEISPDMPLLEYVKNKGMLQRKRGCETSNCGLCTVMDEQKNRFFPVRYSQQGQMEKRL